VIQPGWLEPAALSAYLLAADVALLPYADGASARRGSLLACAAHGLPIVSTTPATAEVAAAVEAVAPDPVALAQAILALHKKNDPAQAAARRRAAQTLAAQTAWPQIAATHAAIYEALLSP
jgi:glycosyltransferase involved in cell wall biosynthesis